VSIVSADGPRHPTVGPVRCRCTIRPVTDLLLATDADRILDEVEAAVGGTHVIHRVRAGADVVTATEIVDPDLVILDLQIGNMGGGAASLALRQEEGAGRLDRRPILLLLDREADVFLAKHTGADDWMIKPIDTFALIAKIESLLADEAVSEVPAEG